MAVSMLLIGGRPHAIDGDGPTGEQCEHPDVPDGPGPPPWPPTAHPTLPADTRPASAKPHAHPRSTRRPRGPHNRARPTSGPDSRASAPMGRLGRLGISGPRGRRAARPSGATLGNAWATDRAPRKRCPRSPLAHTQPMSGHSSRVCVPAGWFGRVGPTRTTREARGPALWRRHRQRPGGFVATVVASGGG